VWKLTVESAETCWLTCDQWLAGSAISSGVPGKETHREISKTGGFDSFIVCVEQRSVQFSRFYVWVGNSLLVIPIQSNLVRSSKLSF
jgi:hypothetical protein